MGKKKGSGKASEVAVEEPQEVPGGQKDGIRDVLFYSLCRAVALADERKEYLVTEEKSANIARIQGFIEGVKESVDAVCATTGMQPEDFQVGMAQVNKLSDDDLLLFLTELENAGGPGDLTGDVIDELDRLRTQVADDLLANGKSSRDLVFSKGRAQGLGYFREVAEALRQEEEIRAAKRKAPMLPGLDGPEDSPAPQEAAAQEEPVEQPEESPQEESGTPQEEPPEDDEGMY